MNILFPFFALSFLLLGIYGGMAAISRWLRGYSGFWIMSPVGGGIYFLTLIVTSSLFFYAMRHMDGILVLLLFAMMPFAIFGHVIWFIGLMMELLARAAGPSDMPIEKTYDVGDGMMARCRFDDAAAYFRKRYQEDEMDIEALLRLARALEMAGREEDAIRDLTLAHRATLEHRDEKTLPKKQRQERLLRLSFALGDLYVKLDQMDNAKQLYGQSIEVLFGYEEAEALRARLKALEEPGRMNFSQAVKSAQPDTLPLD